MLNLTTPALLFSAILLLLLAYTNRFLALAQLIRNLHGHYKQNPDGILLEQIKNLRTRVHIIRYMQISGILSLLLCVLSMLLIYISEMFLSEIIFGIALLLMILSLALSIWGIQISGHALDIHLSDIESNRK